MRHLGGGGGQGTLTRGEKVTGVRILGAEPDAHNRIIRLTEDLIDGRYVGLATEEVVIGYRLAEEMGLALGDRARITSSRGIEQTFTVAGIFDTGQEGIDASWAFVTLRAAQRLFATGTAVTTISLALDDLFAANEVADQVIASLGLEADSWMRESPQALSGLRAQSATAFLISAFSLIAAGFAIASVLIVSVLKRSREIGILKAMGARERQILRVFTLEGLGLALLGATVGAALGIALILAARRIPKLACAPAGCRAAPPGVVRWQTVLGTMGAAIAIDSRQRLSGPARGPPRSGGSDPGWLSRSSRRRDPQGLWRRRTGRGAPRHRPDHRGRRVRGRGRPIRLRQIDAPQHPRRPRPAHRGPWPWRVPFQELESDDLANLRNCKIGFIFQYHYLLDEFTCVENALMPILIRKGVPDSEDVERVSNSCAASAWAIA